MHNLAFPVFTTNGESGDIRSLKRQTQRGGTMGKTDGLADQIDWACPKH